MSELEDLEEEWEKKIDDVFSDTDVSPEQTAARLKAIRSAVNSKVGECLEALESDGVEV